MWLPAGDPLGPGQIDMRRTPYVIAWMRSAAPGSPYRRAIFVGFSQGGKSRALLAIIGHRLDDAPVPILYIAPTRNNCVQIFEPRIDALLRDSPSLKARTVWGKRYTRIRKIVAGVSLRLAWAGSPAEIAAENACIVCIDEPDRMPRDIGGEGSVFTLGDARHGAYDDGKTVACSTPTEGKIETERHPVTGLTHWKPADPEVCPSPIWREWQKGTRHEWAVPCPECREYFIPRRDLLFIPEGATPAEAERDARLNCPQCGAQIESHWKVWMNDRGVAVAPGQSVSSDGTLCGEPPENPAFSLWVSGLMSFSPAATFGALAAALVAARESGDDEALKGVVATKFGECYWFGGEAPTWQEVSARRANYRAGEVPGGVRRLYATVDVQGNRLEYTVRGWALKYRSYLIEAGEFWASTKHHNKGAFLDLDDLLERDFGGLKISAVAIDAGYRQNVVLDWVRRQSRGLAFATKGMARNADRPFYASKIDVTPRGSVKKKSAVIWHVNSDLAKQWVHARMGVEDDDAGAWFLPMDAGRDYCAQIVGEQRVIHPNGRSEWKKTGHNHKLDCEALQWFLARHLQRRIRRGEAVDGPEVKTLSDDARAPEMDDQDGPPDRTETDGSTETAPDSRRRGRKRRRPGSGRDRRRGGGYVTGF